VNSRLLAIVVLLAALVGCNTFVLIQVTSGHLNTADDGDLATIYKSVMGEDGFQKQYNSKALQNGDMTIRVDALRCEQLEDREYECVLNVHDQTGYYGIFLVASCDETGCTWRTDE
jgi:hypothetical protein